MGALPNFQMRSVGPVVYLVVSDHIDTLTIYFFNKFGNKLGSEKYEPTLKFMKELQKSTTVKYQLPKKERKEMADPTFLFQKDFSKVYRTITNTLGITHKYPYTVLVNKNLQLSLIRMFGCKRVKKELHIPQNLKDKNYLELLVTVEWFYSYLTSSIPTLEENTDTIILYDLAILLSAVFNLKFLNKVSVLKLLPHKITIQNLAIYELHIPAI